MDQYKNVSALQAMSEHCSINNYGNRLVILQNILWLKLMKSMLQFLFLFQATGNLLCEGNMILISVQSRNHPTIMPALSFTMQWRNAWVDGLSTIYVGPIEK